MQILVAQIFEQAPENAFHIHAGNGTERDQDVHMRRQADRRVLGIGAGKRQPLQILFRPLFKQGNHFVGGVVRRGMGVGNNPVFLDDRCGVLINRKHGVRTYPLELYRQNRAGVEEGVRRTSSAGTLPAVPRASRSRRGGLESPSHAERSGKESEAILPAQSKHL